MIHMKYLAFLFSVLLLVGCGGDDGDNGTTPTSDPDPIPTPGGGDPVTLAVDIGDSEIPYIVINTGDQAIENEPKVAASMKVYIQSAEVLNGNIGIEYRGSTSFRVSDKKSFGIETWDLEGNDTDMEIFGFPEEEDWILTGHVVNLGGGFAWDKTLMYHYFGYNLYRDMGRYASRTRFVELELNGDYLGVYVFMEKLKRDKERINIEKLNPARQSLEGISLRSIRRLGETLISTSHSITSSTTGKMTRDTQSRLVSDRSMTYLDSPWIFPHLESPIIVVCFGRPTFYMRNQQLMRLRMSRRRISLIIFISLKQPYSRMTSHLM
jgi:hypothetical protein